MINREPFFKIRAPVSACISTFIELVIVCSVNQLFSSSLRSLLTYPSYPIPLILLAF